MNYFVTGGSGFIGSNMVDRLLEQGHNVIAFDNLSTGQIGFLKLASKSSHFKFIDGDLLNIEHLTDSIKGSDFVFHFAANADVRSGTEHPKRDLEQNTIATLNVLEAMRENGIKNIAFSSTGSVYGEPELFPTPEEAPFPIQTSLYGASKLACEGLVTAYAAGFGFKVWIFRLVSILGERYSHGHVFDFYKMLLKNRNSMNVLGDGHQKKSYLYVQDCVDAMQLAIEKSTGSINIYNLGTNEYIEVIQSVKWITIALNLHPKITYEGGTRGWVGDSPFIFLDTKKIEALGWKPKLTIKEGIEKTLNYLQENRWLLEDRN